MAQNKINRIKVELAVNGKTNKWLAEQLGKDVSTVSQWCSNARQPSLETLLKIANVLGIDIRDLLCPTNQKPIEVKDVKDPRYWVMDLSETELRKELETWSRQDIIEWLQWNDSNGVYLDEDSMREFNNICEKPEGIDIMVRQILQND